MRRRFRNTDTDNIFFSSGNSKWGGQVWQFYPWAPAAEEAVRGEGDADGQQQEPSRVQPLTGTRGGSG